MSTVKILPSARLPYNLTRGSVEQRTRKAEEFVENFHNRIERYCINDEIRLSSIQEIFNNVAKDIKIVVGRNDDKAVHAKCDILLDSRDKVYGMTVDLSTHNDIIPRKDILYLLHECRHIADNLFHPKYIKRFQKLAERGLLNDKYYNIYENEVYIREILESKQDKKVVLFLLRRKLNKLLKNKTIDAKIDILQNMRYSLETEQNAFETPLKYIQKYRQRGITVDEDVSCDYREEFIFQDKINLLKAMAAEIISTHRAKHAAKLAKRQKLRQ